MIFQRSILRIGTLLVQKSWLANVCSFESARRANYFGGGGENVGP